MTPAQKAALESVAGRSITTDEEAVIRPLLDSENRNDVAIAALLSQDRLRLKSHLIGIGTILEVMGEAGGLFLDALVTAGTQQRMLYWAMVLINNSNLDIGKQATQDQMTALALAMPHFAAGLDALKALGTEVNPIDYNVVSKALNIAEGRMIL